MSGISNFDPGVFQQARQQTRSQASARPTASTEDASAPLPPKGYRDAGDVERRAGIMSAVESPENVAAVRRLDRSLNSGQPLRGDVPRGYYLSLKV